MPYPPCSYFILIFKAVQLVLVSTKKRLLYIVSVKSIFGDTMRVYNFSPGPSVLPLPVLERAASEMTDTNGTGQSVMEMSHRSKDFKPIIEKTEALLRELMGIPANYKVLFLQGGASLQFSMVPLNLAAGEEPGKGKKAAYIDTGIWADKAVKEAKKYAVAEVRASSKDKSYTYIPSAPAPAQDDAYYHITLNNTIVGTKWDKLPDTGSVPLVSDVSSSILSEPLDVSKFGIIYAGAQKNLGPAGTTVVIIREDLIGKAPAWTPVMLRYDTHAGEGSMYNTPPCYGIYIIGLVLEWVKGLGGVDAIAKLNREKAQLFYDYLDSCELFYSPVDKQYRSLMNIPFVTTEQDEAKKSEIETRFVKEAAAAGLINLAGHRLVGGMRASIYNAMPIEGVKALIGFMEKFKV
jgi:phosphoserine aminotransferase